MTRNNIAEIRRSQKMDQDELAKKLNVTKTYLSSLENSADINKIMLYKIAAELNTTERRIFDFSDRKRTKPNFNPHLEAFWVQGRQAHDCIDKSNRVMIIDKQLCCLDKNLSECIAPIRDIMYLRLFDVYCLLDFADDISTTEKVADMALMFAAGLAGAEFYICATILDKRADIIQSFVNGLNNVKEKRGGKDGFNNIKIIREQHGLTQTALAQKSKITLSTLRLIESKNFCSDVHLKSAKKIAKALACDFTDLFSEVPKDIYNIQAKQAGSEIKKGNDISELVNALDRNISNPELCVRDIIAYLNWLSANETGQAMNIRFTLT